MSTAAWTQWVHSKETNLLAPQQWFTHRAWPTRRGVSRAQSQEEAVSTHPAKGCHTPCTCSVSARDLGCLGTHTSRAGRSSFIQLPRGSSVLLLLLRRAWVYTALQLPFLADLLYWIPLAMGKGLHQTLHTFCSFSLCCVATLCVRIKKNVLRKADWLKPKHWMTLHHIQNSKVWIIWKNLFCSHQILPLRAYL